jgi:hypothetical protein
MKGLRIPLAGEFYDAGFGHGHAATLEAITDLEVVEIALTHRSRSPSARSGTAIALWTFTTGMGPVGKNGEHAVLGLQTIRPLSNHLRTCHCVQSARGSNKRRGRSRNNFLDGPAPQSTGG